ncbi:MAG: hypothetical protein FJ098_07820, partial [Deltaproteobacteria bacterium]|nr:hypothetical protein [Deltaproteobacteria bacterium]
MKQHGLFLALSALVVSLAGREAAAEPPGVLHLSGRIADGGEPVQGPASLTVTFWSDAVSSEPAAVLWTDVIQVQADGGLFHALVGAAPENPLPGDLFSGGDVFIGLAVDDAEELSPRLPVASVPYALEAGDAATLQGQGPNAFAAADHTHPPAFSAGEGVVLDGGVLALDEMMVLQWAQEACYDSP